MENPYVCKEIKLQEVVEESPAIKTFRFKPKGGFHFTTGQFVELGIPGVGEAPFTPSSNPEDKESLEITIMNAGKVTSRLHEMKGGETLGIRGPLGDGYPLDKFKGKEVYIVGGGVGLAPLRSLLYELLNNIKDYKKVLLRGGAKTPKDLIYKEQLKEWSKRKDLDVKITVDAKEGDWNGHVGIVTTILDRKDVDPKNSVAVVCGPPIMMKFVTFNLLEMGYEDKDIYLSMEKNMSCGIGKCGHCRIGTYHACKDGPVFTYDKIKNFHEIWD